MSETEAPRLSRKEQILQSLAEMLEQSPGMRITTAALAKHVGVSEAALYRHFPSKSKMFEALIEFIEDTLFSRISKIMTESESTEDRCYQIIFLVLTFTERNPGITRILTGDPLAGESDKLRQRVAQLFERLETQFRQVLREAEMRDSISLKGDTTTLAALMLNTIDGRISQFVRSEFQKTPTEGWPAQWQLLRQAIF